MGSLGGWTVTHDVIITIFITTVINIIAIIHTVTVVAVVTTGAGSATTAGLATQWYCPPCATNAARRNRV